MQKNNLLAALEVKGIIPQKRWGQNFLITPNILKKIIRIGKLEKEDNILEIGPGLGFLTELLLKNSGKVVAIEKDSRCCFYLKKKFSQIPKTKFFLLNEDILKTNLPLLLKTVFKKKTAFPKYKVIANLPYNIATRIVKILLSTEFPPQKMVLMFQKEVGESICSKPPQMTRLGAQMQLISDPFLHFLVEKQNFYPIPQVDSAVVSFENIKSLSPEIKKVQKLIKIGFTSPRKTLVNNLSNVLNFDKSNFLDLLNKLEKKEKVRAQEINLSQWQILSKHL